MLCVFETLIISLFIVKLFYGLMPYYFGLIDCEDFFIDFLIVKISYGLMPYFNQFFIVNISYNVMP